MPKYALALLASFPINVYCMEQILEYSRISLYPGELHIAEKPTIVWTLLGSCVAVVFHNTRLRIGAICHAQLAERNHSGAYQCSASCPAPCFADVHNENPFKFVSCSIRYMMEHFTERGILPCEIDVKLFGGASILPKAHQTKSVGELNSEIAQLLIQEYQLKLVSKHIGGVSGRTLYFYSDTGEVFLKRQKS